MKLLGIIEAVLAVIKILIHLGVIKAEDADRAVAAAVKDVTKDIT